MTYLEKQELWRRHPQVWELFVEFNDIVQEDDEAWGRLVDRADQIREVYGPEIKELLIDTVDQLDRMARKRRGYG